MPRLLRVILSFTGGPLVLTLGRAEGILTEVPVTPPCFREFIFMGTLGSEDNWRQQLDPPDSVTFLSPFHAP